MDSEFERKMAGRPRFQAQPDGSPGILRTFSWPDGQFEGQAVVVIFSSAVSTAEGTRTSSSSSAGRGDRDKM